MDVYSLKQIKAASSPYALSPIPGPKTRNTTSWVTKIFGIRAVRDLGILTTFVGGTLDSAIVQRSWGLLGYGPKFSFAEYSRTRNYLKGAIFHFALMIGGLLLTIPLIRRVGKKYVCQPGDGPTKEESENDRFEYRGIGTPDIDTPEPPRAFCRVSFEGSLYVCKYIFPSNGPC
jgi:hypothetical protein